MKFIKTFVLTLVISTLFIVKVNAFTLDPNSGSFATSREIKLNVVANPSAGNQNALQLRLKVENGEFINFEPQTDPSYIAVIKDCNGESYFTKTDICASFARTKPIVKGEILGVITLKLNQDSFVTLTKTDKNGYSDGVNFFKDSGEAAKFTVGTPIQPTNNVINDGTGTSATQGEDISSLYPIIAIGIAVVIIVLIIILVRSGIVKKNTKLAVIGFLVLIGLVLFLAYQVLQNQSAKSTNASINCNPSVQARFHIVEGTSDKGLVSSGSYPIASITKFEFTVVTNMIADPSHYFSGNIKVTGPGNYSKTATSGAPVTITPIAAGSYNITASNNQGECDNETITITPAASVNCTTINYSEWSACVNGRQTRTITSSAPTGCSLSGDPQLQQACEVPISIPPVTNPCGKTTQADCTADVNGAWCSNVSRCFPKDQASTVNCTAGQSNADINARIDSACNINTTITCGPIDTDNDNKLTIIDFAQFARVYGRTNCNDAATDYSPCGGKDTDSDGSVDIIDFASFANRYGLASCSIVQN